MKKRNKKYSGPKQTYNPIGLACNAAKLISHENQKWLIGPAIEAFQKFMKGEARRDEWERIVEILNAGEALCELNIGNNLIEYLNNAHEAMNQIGLRMIADKGSVCHMSELEAIREGINCYGVQIKLCSQSEYNRAVDIVNNLRRSIKTIKVKQSFKHLREQ